MDRGGSGEVGTTQQRDVRVTGAYYRWVQPAAVPTVRPRYVHTLLTSARRTMLGIAFQTFDSNSKELSNRRCTGRMLRPRKTLGRSADLKVKMKHCFTLLLPIWLME
ncbi:hypothetical protein EVAR_24937_1 [Eumeta japonica]|uniref:Uncharacterized protein n=1 Tax=Eumeta variegata TaxID=151549 RepID=A0A4C1V5G0_EUMVA|nr:hypothetical protein EVAR_24937_1 [Eumeta japonica]